MTNTSVNEVSSFINKQINHQQTIQDHLLKIEAIAHNTLRDDFFDQGRVMLHAYLCTLCEMITETKNLHEKVIDDFLKFTNNLG